MYNHILEAGGGERIGAYIVTRPFFFNDKVFEQFFDFRKRLHASVGKID